MYYMGFRCPTGKGTFGMSVRLKSIVKHRISGGGVKRVSSAKSGGPMLTIYTSYDVFLRKELPFGGRS